jgi:hypothetical protein
VTGQTTQSITDRLLSKIRVNAETGCWIWTANKNNKGYGKLRVGDEKQYAHRVAYELYRGPIPKGIVVCHRCDNPACVNPDHLFLGTQAENIADMMVKGRQRLTERRGTCNGNSKLSEADVVAIRSAENLKLRELAAHYGVTPTLISYIRRGKNWSHVQ